jgi:hypothetical protein
VTSTGVKQTISLCGEHRCVTNNLLEAHAHSKIYRLLTSPYRACLRLVPQTSLYHSGCDLFRRLHYHSGCDLYHRLHLIAPGCDLYRRLHHIALAATCTADFTISPWLTALPLSDRNVRNRTSNNVIKKPGFVRFSPSHQGTGVFSGASFEANAQRCPPRATAGALSRGPSPRVWGGHLINGDWSAIPGELGIKHKNYDTRRLFFLNFRISYFRFGILKTFFFKYQNRKKNPKPKPR